MQHNATLTDPADSSRDVQPERLVALEGAQNFRDLGGYSAADGRPVRWRRVFRAAALQDLTPRDVDTLADLAVADVFDLRTVREREHFGTNPLAPRGVHQHHVPFIAEVGRAADEAAAPARRVDPDDPRPIADGYLSMLERGGPAVASIFAHLAARPDGATVFHCTAGKDRTGIVAALLLSALGVARDDVVADYALTARYLSYDQAAVDRMAAFYRMPGRVGAASANPDVMALTLAGLDARHGSPDGYLAASGVSDAELAALRAALLEG